MQVWEDAAVGLRPPVPQVQEIVFRNFYTAFLSVRVQRPGPGGSRRWVTCLRDLCLMPCPHTEEGSQDYFCLHRHQVSMSAWDCAITHTSGAHPSSPTPQDGSWPWGSVFDAPLTPTGARLPVPHTAQPALKGRCFPWAPSVWGGLGVLGGYSKSCPQSVPAPVVTLPGPCPADAVRRGPGDSNAVHLATALPSLAPLHHRGPADFPSWTEGEQVPELPHCQAWVGGQDKSLSPALCLAFPPAALGSTHRGVGPSSCSLLGHLRPTCAPVVLGKGLL